MKRFEFRVSKNKEKIFDRLKQMLGLIALIVGLLGLLFPILPGWLLIFIGLELLGIHIVFIERLKEYALKKLEEAKKRGRGKNEGSD